MAFEDKNTDAVYVISNSFPAQRKERVIEYALAAANGRPVNCVFLASTLSDPSAEDLLYDLAWESQGSFKVMEVSDNGRFQKCDLVFGGESRKVRTTTGHTYAADKFVAMNDNPLFSPPTGMIPNNISLPWQR